MSLIAVKDLALTRSQSLFAGLSFSIAKGDRLGLVAANGRGKSSLLRIMAGMDEATIGTVTWSRGLVVAFAPQDPPEHLLRLSLYAAVRDALAPEVAETESWRVDILLDDLAVDGEIRDRMVDNLSGGWQRTMLLARAAVVEPDLLLLDEPTNHMDIGRIGVLERFLAALPRDCAVVAASHDRAFLDDVTNRTPVSATGRERGFRPAVFPRSPGAGRARRGATSPVRERHAKGPCAATAGGEIEEHRHQFWFRSPGGEDQAAFRTRRSAGRTCKSRA